MSKKSIVFAGLLLVAALSFGGLLIANFGNVKQIVAGPQVDFKTAPPIENANPQLKGLNDAKENYSLFVLFFLIQLTKNIGLSPDFEDLNSDNETFFTKNEFYVIKSEISTLKSLEKCTVDTVGDIIADTVILNKLISTYERFLTNHTLGNKYYKSTKVFRELNLSA